MGETDQPELRVTVCASFHRDLEGLAKTLARLRAYNCRVLAPTSADFDDPTVPFVRIKGEKHGTIREVEMGHCLAILDSHFVWVHAPGGYVGTACAFEQGFALNANIPVFASEPPSDVMLREFVTIVPSPEAAADMIRSLLKSVKGSAR